MSQRETLQGPWVQKLEPTVGQTRENAPDFSDNAQAVKSGSEIESEASTTGELARTPESSAQTLAAALQSANTLVQHEALSFILKYPVEASELNTVVQRILFLWKVGEPAIAPFGRIRGAAGEHNRGQIGTGDLNRWRFDGGIPH